MSYTHISTYIYFFHPLLRVYVCVCVVYGNYNNASCIISLIIIKFLGDILLHTYIAWSSTIILTYISYKMDRNFILDTIKWPKNILLQIYFTWSNFQKKKKIARNISITTLYDFFSIQLLQIICRYKMYVE